MSYADPQSWTDVDAGGNPVVWASRENRLRYPAYEMLRKALEERMGSTLSSPLDISRVSGRLYHSNWISAFHNTVTGLIGGYINPGLSTPPDTIIMWTEATIMASIGESRILPTNLHIGAWAVQQKKILDKLLWKWSFGSIETEHRWVWAGDNGYSFGNWGSGDTFVVKWNTIDNRSVPEVQDQNYFPWDEVVGDFPIDWGDLPGHVSRDLYNHQGYGQAGSSATNSHLTIAEIRRSKSVVTYSNSNQISGSEADAWWYTTLRNPAHNVHADSTLVPPPGIADGDYNVFDSGVVFGAGEIKADVLYEPSVAIVDPAWYFISDTGGVRVWKFTGHKGIISGQFLFIMKYDVANGFKFVP